MRDRSLPPVPKGRTILRAPSSALAAAVASLMIGVTAASASDDAPASLTVQGTLMHVVSEDFTHDEGLDPELDVSTLVQVGDALIDVPPDMPAQGLTGDPVRLTVEVPRGTSVEEAVATLAAEADGTEDPVVTLVEVAPSESTTAATAEEPPLASAVTTTNRRLTLLPVYWSTTDSTPASTFQSLAEANRKYWADQSGGRIAVSSDVRGWKRIPDPGGCNASAIWQSALTAHGVAAPRESAGEHVAVYFPKISSCGFAGLASITGGAIWINGTPLADVVIHEFGHNLGLGHAHRMSCRAGGADVALAPLADCTVVGYGDRADVMGIATSKISGNLNTALADHLGLVQVSRPAAGSTVTLDLAPLSRTSALRSIAIPAAEGTVYVDYRPAEGRDVRHAEWAGVQVHLQTKDPKFGYPTTYLLDMTPEHPTAFAAPALAPGRSWKVPGTSQEITVGAVGTAARVTVAPARSSIFTDVPVDHQFYSEIAWLSGERITTGLGDGSFGTLQPITREAMAAFLYRYAKVSGYVPPARPRFVDVPVGHQFYTEISWLSEQGITTGLSGGRFGPRDQISREAIAAFLYRFAQVSDYTPPSTARFSDVPVGHVFYDEISWFAANGITTGRGDGSFGALASATRQDVAAFLFRFDRTV
jgi:hypothetical protein